MSFQQDMASAALRHLTDSEHLCGAGGSLDQAFHLAGFGPECARKAALTQAQLQKVLGHQTSDPDVLAWVLSLEPRARFALRPAPTSDWSPAARYRPTGTYGPEVVPPFVSSCVHDAVPLVAYLWCSGLSIDEDLP